MPGKPPNVSEPYRNMVRTMEYIYQTSKMCFIFFTQHNWLFSAQKILLCKSTFCTILKFEISEFYISYTPSIG